MKHASWRWVVWGLGIGMVLLPAGMGGSLTSASSSPVQVSWEVRIGSEGGFTGGGAGHVIRSDGAVYSWTASAAAGPLATKLLGRAAPEAVQTLARALAAPALRALNYQKTGNMTSFLEWSQESELRKYSWPEQPGAPLLPAPLKQAHDAARAAVASVSP